MHLKSKKGFTLIELLVVIAIIGILASVVFASLNSAREKARITSTSQQLRASGIAFTMMVDSDFNSVFPPEWDVDGDGVGGLESNTNPNLNTVSNSTSLGDYIDLTQEITINANNKKIGQIIRYDNDGDSYDHQDCLQGGSGGASGARLVLNGFTSDDEDVVKKIHDAMDSDGDYVCGKVSALQFASGGNWALFVRLDF